MALSYNIFLILNRNGYTNFYCICANLQQIMVFLYVLAAVKTLLKRVGSGCCNGLCWCWFLVLILPMGVYMVSGT